MARATIAAPSKVAQEGEQHGDDEQAAFEQVFLHGVDHVIDQLGAVVDGGYADIGRQPGFDFVQSLFHVGGDFVRVFPHQHEAQSHHNFALPVGGDGAAADFGADGDVGHIPYAHRHAMLRLR